MLGMTTPRFFLTMTLLVLASCNFTRVENLPQWPTATTVRGPQTTLVPTLDRQLRDVPTTEAEGVLSGSCESDQAQATTQHTIVADVNYAQRTATVSQSVRYINRTGEALSDLRLNVEPNIWLGAFTLDHLLLDGSSPVFELTGRRLFVQLRQVLEPGCQITVELGFHLVIPPIGSGLDAYKGFFGYSARQLNLGHWLPTLAVRQNHEWVTREAVAIGEQEVLEVADWDVTVNVSDALDTLRVAAPGEMTEITPLSWGFVHTGARDFPISMSETFNLITRALNSDVQVELYSFDDAVVPTEQGDIDSPLFALDVASRSLALYAERFGPYPYRRMLVVQADFPDGMELSGLVFVGGEYFRSFLGDPASFLTVITAHEIAHQWWYGKVGNDQALSPWLDEALATYSEYIFIEEYYPQLTDWWWRFRVDHLEPEGFVDSTVYEFPTMRAYINAVYLRGVRMLHALRGGLGTDVFLDWLHRYAEAAAGQVATPDMFWSLLTPDQFQATSITRQQYLRQPQIVYLRNP
jgi:hypothetical protein